MDWLDEIKFNEDGLVAAIAQDWQTGRVLMMAWMNRESLQLTIQHQQAVYWSRSRGKLWFKGEQSGNQQVLKSISLDCDGDAVLMQVEQRGGVACHTGRESCFYRTLTQDGDSHTWSVQEPVLVDPDNLYGTK